MRNKGFSWVEAIVGMAVLVVLVIVLFPTAKQYLHRMNVESDMKKAKTIAEAITEALADDSVRDNAVAHATPQAVSDLDGADFHTAVYRLLETDEVKGRTRKDAEGTDLPNREFLYTLDTATRKVVIYYGGISEEYRIYPTAGSKFVP